MKFNKSQVDDYAEAIYTEGEKAKIWSDILRSCLDLKSIDRCDRAKERRDCLIEGLDKAGASLRDFALT